MNRAQNQADNRTLKINSIKKLYHGTDKMFDTVDLELCNRFKDFGKGYYLTTNLKQAQRWAQQKAEYATEAYIYSYDILKPVDQELKILELLDYDKQWVDFISECRIWGRETDYDIIYDRIADNQRSEIANALQKYITHTVNADSVIQMIRWKRENGDQYCFKTYKALSVLDNERRFVL